MTRRNPSPADWAAAGWVVAGVVSLLLGAVVRAYSDLAEELRKERAR